MNDIECPPATHPVGHVLGFKLIKRIIVNVIHTHEYITLFSNYNILLCDS